MNIKFMQTVEADVYRRLRTMAKDRGVSVQELLRAVILPDWISVHNDNSHRRKTARTERRMVNA